MIVEPLLSSIERMRRTADGYLDDADILQSQIDSVSDAGYLLRLTAFEILLKAVLRCHEAVVKPHHNYRAHFENLSPEVQEHLWKVAASRMGPGAEYSDTGRLLTEWSTNFSHLRYSYEAYEGQSSEEVRAMGEAWLASGGKLEEASVRYYPEELTGVLYALQAELESLLGQ
mgnify:CR=1 FL=1